MFDFLNERNKAYGVRRVESEKNNSHPKCKAPVYPNMGDYGNCGYNTKIDCDDCKYGSGRKDPASLCNQLKVN